MRFSSAMAASAFASILVLPGILLSACGGSGDEDAGPPPDDFAIAVEHVAGSTPPPDHTEWTLTVDEDLQATLEYTAGYPGPNNPAYKAQFDVESAAISDLYDGLEENDLLRDQDPLPTEETPIGGTTVTATVTADGETYEIAAQTAEGAPLQPLAGLIHRLVPHLIWNDFETRAKQHYAGGGSGEDGSPASR